MIENTLQTAIDAVKDLTGQTNLSDAKAVRALNFGVDDYTRQRLNATGKWSPDSTNHGNIARITATLGAGETKVSLPTELLSIRQVEINTDSGYTIVEPTDTHDHADVPLDVKYGNSSLPRKYDVLSNHLYFHPTSDSDRTVRIEYRRAHPRFETTNLTQNIGVLPIDEEYVILYAADYVAIGLSDSERNAIAEKLERKRREIHRTFGNLDQDTKKIIKPKLNTVFSKNSF